MAVSNNSHREADKLLASKGNVSQTALIPYCWLITPFDTTAFPKLGFQVLYRYHLSNLFISAVSNVEQARPGHQPNATELKYRRHILSFWGGWSATPVEHMNDPCFSYIRHRYRQIKDMTPVLDNIIYPEQVAWMPRSIYLEMATLLLLASPDRYYVYLVEYDALLDAGPMLKDVYEGLREVKRVATFLGCPWEPIEPFELWEVDHYLYFPDYDHRRRTLMWKLSPFIPFVCPRDEPP